MGSEGIDLGISAGAYMVKWSMLDPHVRMNQLHFMPGDNVNVFINFECVLRNLSLYKNIPALIARDKKNIVISLESSILNLIAHYKSYFKKEKCNPKIYLYYTDLSSEKDQQMEIYNKYYRSYYHNKYIQNPQFKQMGELLNDIIIPEVELILSYVEGCYFVRSKSFDSSVIPMIISSMSEMVGYKNVIVTGDVFDTLYMFNLNFMTVYIKRRYQHFELCSQTNEVVQSIVKNESPFDLNIFNSELYFRLLLAIKGSKIRNIKSAKGFGYGKFMKILEQGIKDGNILQSFESLDSIIQLFPEKYRKDIKNAFICTSIETQYSLINDVDISYIKSQLVDKVDMASVEALNNKRFIDYPINLHMLL